MSFAGLQHALAATRLVSTTSSALSAPTARSFARIARHIPSAPPKLNIPVSSQHGLWAFFRKVPHKDNNERGRYITLERAHERDDKSGRAWTAPELRRKSFQDLHTLWYLLLRERNLLETQERECKRLGLPTQLSSIGLKDRRCRLSMARIKFVLNERRIAFGDAVEEAASEKVAPPPVVPTTSDSTQEPTIAQVQ